MRVTPDGTVDLRFVLWMSRGMWPRSAAECELGNATDEAHIEDC